MNKYCYLDTNLETQIPEQFEEDTMGRRHN